MSDVTTTVRNGIGIIRLDRPRSINALTTPMCRTITDALTAWRDDDGIGSVLVESSSPRGLCAGGDVRQVRADALAGEPERGMEFWRVEYEMDALIAGYPKPVTVLMEGIVMGGGVGLAGHASRRVVTHDTRVAMPETAIGYFPDVGVTWLLARAPGQLGTHLAMTGVTITGSDALAVGLADHHVDSIAAAREAILSGQPLVSDPIPPSSLAAQRDWIDECYDGDDPVAVVARLESHPDDAARAAAATIRSRSPLSVALALATVRQAATLPDVAATLERDHRLNRQMLERSDFAEGVRIVLVDKWQGPPPRWLYPTVEDVPADLVQQMLQQPDDSVGNGHP